MSDDGGSTVPIWLIVLTVATSCGFAVAFGSSLFESKNTGDCDNFLTCAGAAAVMVGALFQFIFIGAFATNLPLPLQLIMFLLVNVPWILITVRLIIAGIQAVATFIP